jgi:GNAT superfamily N-acetyltransferase
VTLRIRSFESTDRDGLSAAIDAVCAEGKWMITPRFQPTPAWIHALDTPDCPYHLLLVVEDNNRIVGWCRLLPTMCNAQADQVGMGIGLLPDYRDRGIGTHLVQYALEWAKGNNVQRVTLTSGVDNARAIHVFEKCGFSRTGHIDANLIEMACEQQLEESL